MGIFNSLRIDPNVDTTIAQQLADQLMWHISANQLQPGDRLPSIRSLAGDLKVNLLTVRAAYKKLASSGLIAMQPGRTAKVLHPTAESLLANGKKIPTHTVGIILPGMSNPFYSQFMDGVQRIADQDGTLLFVCLTDESSEQAERYMLQLMAKKVDGILLISVELEPHLEKDILALEASAQNLPVVSVDAPNSSLPGILPDLEGAGYLATRHLIDHGYQHIGILTVRIDGSNINQINAGCRRALAEHGLLERSEPLILADDFKIRSGQLAIDALLTRPDPPRAIFAVSDTLAIGAMQAIKQRGLRIPQDMAVVGFNNIPLAELVEPGLTTVDASSFELGNKAMQLLKGLQQKQPPPKHKIIQPVRLVIRQSCGEHPQEGNPS